MSPETTYTLAEVTPRLCPDCDDKEAYRISRKLQNQVNAGLIRPVQNVHAGRGVHRRYDQYELYKMRVLLELDRFKIPNRVLRLVADLFDDTNPDRGKGLRRESSGKQKFRAQITKYIADAINNEDTILLLINLGETGSLTANLVKAKEFRPAWTSAIMLNLTEIIQSIR